MKREKFEEVIENLKLPKREWITLTEIDSIVLKDGVGIYPNWVHMRFLLLENEIIIKHGESEPYGARLCSRFAVSEDMMSIMYPPEAIIAPSDFYSNFRVPREGDILRSTVGLEKVLSESLIASVIPAFNQFTISLTNPIKMNKDFRLSFYDPMMFDPKYCIHGTEEEGIYLKFQENYGRNKKFGVQHQIIKVKDIKEINLKLSSKFKTYKIM